MAKPQIVIENINKTFGAFTAVDNINLRIYKGEMFALVGASGCGKTTLLRMLAGFATPSSGRIMIEDADMTQVPPHERPVNMMFQSYALFPHMTVEENVGYGLRRLKLAGADKTKRVTDALEMVQLGHLAKRKPHQLSGGQRQRVALARALIRRHKVLLLDEPLSALDKKLREQTQFELMNIQYQVGITFVFVTHDQDEAMELADRVVVLNEGRIEQVGTPAELYDSPASAFVISFVGEAVALPVTVADGHIRFGARELHIDSGGLRSGPAKVYFRPADIAIAPRGGGQIEGRVESLRRTPGGVRAAIAIEGYDQVLEIDSPLDGGAALGDRIPLELTNARVFPTGEGVLRGDGEGI